MTIRLKLALIVSALSAALLLSLGYTIITTMRQASGAAIAESANRIAGHLLTAASEWGFERGLTNGALTVTGPIAPAALSEIQARRRTGDQNWDEALKQITPAMESPQLTKALADATAARTALAALRTRFDALAAQPDPAAAASLRTQWFDQATRSIMESQGVRHAIELALITTPEAALVSGLAVKHNLFVMIEFLGRERGFLNALIGGGQQLTPQQLLQLGLFFGEVDAAWDIVSTRRSSLGPEFKTAIDQFEGIFTRSFLPLRERLITAGYSGQAYPVPPAEWFQQSTTTIEALLQARRQATLSIDALARETVAQDNAVVAIEITLAIAAVILVVIAFLILSRQVVRPMRTLTDAMRLLADGKLETEVPAHPRHDEIGAMVDTVVVFKTNALQVQRLEAEQAATKQAEAERRAAEMAALADAFEGSVKAAATSVSVSAADMIETATLTAQRQEQGTMRSLTVNEATNNTRERITALAAAGEELAASINEIGMQVSRTAETARRATTDVGTSRDQIRRLAEATQQIGSVVQLITEIAEQTNLLALNATIEAARAGDAGRGFAVVASEVKLLANQTAQATAQITRQIDAIQDETHAAVAAIDRVGDIVDAMESMTGSVAAAVEEQSAVTNEIAQTITHITVDMDQVATNIKDVTGSSIRSCAASIQVLWSSESVAEISDRLTSDVDAFLSRIRERGAA